MPELEFWGPVLGALILGFSCGCVAAIAYANRMHGWQLKTASEAATRVPIRVGEEFFYVVPQKEYAIMWSLARGFSNR